MSSDDFTITTIFETTPQRLYEAIATRDGIAAWWTKSTTFGGRVGSVAEMRFPDAGFYAKMKVVRLDPPKLVEWECVDSEHPERSGFSDLKEWSGTELRFEIEPIEEAKTRLRFTHVGLVPKLECDDSCRSIWSFYIGDSLRGLVEKETGKPYGA